MKNRISLMLLSFLFVCTTKAATIYVNVHNVNGNLVQNAYVKLYDSNWNLISSHYTDASGIATFALLDYGTYNYEVYYQGDTQEFWGDGENINLQNPTLSVNFTRFWPYRYSYQTPPSNVFTGDNETFKITVRNNVSFSRNVKVELWVDRDKSSTWDFHQLSNAQSISSNGTKTFTFNYTPETPGTYYWKMYVWTYNDGSNAYLPTDSYFWSNAFTAKNRTGALTVYVKNVSGSYVENAKVKLYNNSGNSIETIKTNSAGEASFNNLNYGTYSYEVFYQGDANEFWGDKEGLDLKSSSLTSNFTRFWPYRYGYQTPSSIVNANDELTYSVKVKNKVSFSRNVKVELWIDSNKSSPWDYHKLSDAQSISSNGTKTFTFNYTPETPGTYYWKMYVWTYNDGSQAYIPTDSYYWSNAFDVISYNLPIKNGAFCYHVYSNYLEVPASGDTIDGNVFIHNLKTGETKNITYDLGIANSMNPDFNSRGSEIVFMAIPQNKEGETTYNTDKNYTERLRKNLEIYIYNFATKTLTRLTNNDIPDEDPKFSPNGQYIIFKQNDIIKEMDISSNIIYTLTDNGTQINGSMPYLTTNGKKILYAKGSGSNSDIYIIDSAGTNNKALYAEQDIDEYYPIVKDASSFLYTRWVSSTNKNDQIYLGDFYGNSKSLPINDQQNNYSDPAPVGSDYLLFSSTRNKTRTDYDIYLGQISTNAIWSFNELDSNQHLNDLGSCYSPLLRNIFIKFKSNPLSGGTITGDSCYAPGETAELKATPNTGYSFIGWTENGNKVSSYSDYNFEVNGNRTLVANFESSTGVKNLTSEKGLLIYPNPTNGVFTVKGEKLQIIYILDANGTIIKHLYITDKQHIIVDMRNLQKGIYFVRVISNDKIFTKKVIYK